MTENELREKVIKGLECCSSGEDKCLVCPYYGVCYVTQEFPFWAIFANAIALLKAQEPIKPVVDIDTWKCGNCGHTLEHQELLGDNVLFHEQYNYCPECGRAVKWE